MTLRSALQHRILKALDDRQGIVPVFVSLANKFIKVTVVEGLGLIIGCLLLACVSGPQRRTLGLMTHRNNFLIFLYPTD